MTIEETGPIILIISTTTAGGFFCITSAGTSNYSGMTIDETQVMNDQSASHAEQTSELIEIMWLPFRRATVGMPSVQVGMKSADLVEPRGIEPLTS